MNEAPTGGMALCAPIRILGGFAPWREALGFFQRSWLMPEEQVQP